MEEQKEQVESSGDAVVEMQPSCCRPFRLPVPH